MSGAWAKITESDPSYSLGLPNGMLTITTADTPKYECPQYHFLTDYNALKVDILIRVVHDKRAQATLALKTRIKKPKSHRCSRKKTPLPHSELATRALCNTSNFT